MSFSISWILPRLAVGSAPRTEADVRRLEQLGVTYVLDLREPFDNGEDTSGTPGLYAGSGITYRRLPMADNGQQKPASDYVQGVTFVRDALAEPNSKVFVHCMAGMYRSPAMIYAVLRSMGYSQTAAWQTVLAGRSVARDQYLPGAEASVPQLPTSGHDRRRERVLWWMTAGAFGAGTWWIMRNRPDIARRISRTIDRYV